MKRDLREDCMGDMRLSRDMCVLREKEPVKGPEKGTCFGQTYRTYNGASAVRRTARGRVMRVGVREG